MNSINLDALGITKDDIINRAAEKLADSVFDEDLYSHARSILTKRIDKIVEETLSDTVENTLSEVMGRVLDEVVQPRNIWGEKEGNPTTIRTALSERARDFWNVKVSKEGKPYDGYGGKPRHEWLMEQVVRQEFENAVKANISDVVAAFKSAMSTEAAAWVSQYIAKVFPNGR